jgi:hypothetical protein
VTEQQPDLFEVAGPFAAQSGAGAQVLGGKNPQIEIARIFAHNPPTAIVGRPFFADRAGLVNRTEQRPRPISETEPVALLHSFRLIGKSVGGGKMIKRAQWLLGLQMRLRSLMNYAIISVFTLSLFAQESRFEARSRVVLIPAMVTDVHGRVVDGLEAPDFHVFDNGGSRRFLWTH